MGHDNAVLGQMSKDQGVKLLRVEFGNGLIVGVRKIDYDAVIFGVALLDKDESVLIVHRDFSGIERILIQRHNGGEGLAQPCHLRIEVNEINGFDAFMFQNFADGHTVPASKHKNALGHPAPPQCRVNQRLMVAVLILLGELQMAIYEKPQIIVRPRICHGERLIRALLLPNHLVKIEVMLGKRRDPRR